MAKRVELVCMWLMGMALGLAYATDPNQLQDFCVAVNPSYESYNQHELFVNGRFCKDPKDVKPEDFLFRGLNIPGNTNNKLGFNGTRVNVDSLPGLNTLGIALARIDFAPYGVNPPHTHPRATEVFTVIKGTIYVGFVTSDQYGNKLFSYQLKEGDVFVFPEGLIHFQYNVGNTPAVAISALSSQNPGQITIPNAVFASSPAISTDVLSKAFKVDQSVIEKLQSQCSNYNGYN